MTAGRRASAGRRGVGADHGVGRVGTPLATPGGDAGPLSPGPRAARHRAGPEASRTEHGQRGGRDQGEVSPDLYSPPGVLYNPPVVDILEGVAGHLLLVGAAAAILVSARRGYICGWGTKGPAASPYPPPRSLQTPPSELSRSTHVPAGLKT